MRMLHLTSFEIIAILLCSSFHALATHRFCCCFDLGCTQPSIFSEFNAYLRFRPRSPPPRSPPPPHYRRSRSPFSPPRYYRGGDRGGHSQSPHRHYSRSPPPSRGTPPPKGPRTPPGPGGEEAGPASGDQPGGGGQEGQKGPGRPGGSRSRSPRSRSATPPLRKRRSPPPDPRDTNEKGPGIIYDETAAAATQVREGVLSLCISC